MESKKAIALGNFDGVHKGHIKLLNCAKAYAEKNGLRSAVFTFVNDADAVMGKGNGLIYSGEEKLSLLSACGIDCMICPTADREFLSKNPQEFLSYLDGFNVQAYFVGADYRFGNGAQGTVQTLTDYALSHGKTVVTVPFEKYNGEKISSSRIKNCLVSGDISNANAMLGSPYFATGIVVNERHIGGKIGFPTANLSVSEEKLKIKNGVYSGRITVNGSVYPCAVNYGPRPTFGMDGVFVEAHAIGCNKDFYGENVKIELLSYLREIKDFGSKELLAAQIAEDIKRCL